MKYKYKEIKKAVFYFVNYGSKEILGSPLGDTAP